VAISKISGAMLTVHSLSLLLLLRALRPRRCPGYRPRPMPLRVPLIVFALLASVRDRADLVAENIALRQQLPSLHLRRRPRLGPSVATCGPRQPWRPLPHVQPWGRYTGNRLHPTGRQRKCCCHLSGRFRAGEISSSNRSAGRLGAHRCQTQGTAWAGDRTGPRACARSLTSVSGARLVDSLLTTVEGRTQLRQHAPDRWSLSLNPELRKVMYDYQVEVLPERSAPVAAPRTLLGLVL